MSVNWNFQRNSLSGTIFEILQHKILVFDPSRLPKVDYFKYLFLERSYATLYKKFLDSNSIRHHFQDRYFIPSFWFMTLTLRGHRRSNILVFFGQAI